MKDIDKQRDMAFDKHMKYTNDILTAMDDHTSHARRQLLQQMNDFRQLYQRPELRRDFDLYDPAARLKDKPARVGDEDPRCGVSGMQRFEGEDLQERDRLKMQKDQMKVWTKEQMYEREMKRMEELNERRRYEEYENNVTRKLEAIQNAVDAAKKEQARIDKETNLELVGFVKFKKRRRRFLGRIANTFLFLYMLPRPT
jgi:hypothetical protein